MRIAYIILTQKVSSGVEKTLKQRADSILNENKNFKFFILNAQHNKNEDNIQYLKIPYRYKSFSYFFNFLFRKYKIIESLIPLNSFDYIILRYPYADGSAKKFASKYNIITEHHTFEREELINNIKNKNKFFDRFFDLIDLINDVLFAKQFFKNTKGIIALTKEIGLNTLKLNPSLPFNVITNGIDSDNYPLKTSITKGTAERIDLVMLASKYNSWHGIERIIKAIESYKGKMRFYLNIVGNINTYDLSIEIPSYLSDQIIFHGLLSQEEIDEVINIADIGVGTMALYKKKMDEACPLKIREYIARGIPFIYAYTDNDFDEGFPYALQFENNNSTIDLELVVKFYHDLQKMNNIRSKLKSFAKAKLDLEVKAIETIGFIHSLSNHSRPV